LGIGLVLVWIMLALFASQTPEGEDFVFTLWQLIQGQMSGPRRMVPYFIGGILLLCLGVAGVCILLTTRLSRRLTQPLSTLRQAANRLEEGDLDFEILACEDRELDDLCQALEGVRQRLKASAAAEAAAQEERGLLMANLSHDLRTPVTAIKGYVEGIQDGIARTEEQKSHYLDTIYAKSLVMEKLVRNMSDFSEYELGRMQYHFEYVELASFLQDLVEEYAADAQQHNMTFTHTIPQGTFQVTADRNKLKRVLDNLVSNAVKYGRPDGTIHLTAEPYESGVVIQVSDNGKGIPKEALHHVFDSFFRADAARSSSTPGSGLGLAICRSIIASHHGKIWLTSQEGTGTQAFVYLPLS
jgi:signal transduction histidine kinase